MNFVPVDRGGWVNLNQIAAVQRDHRLPLALVFYSDHERLGTLTFPTEADLARWSAANLAEGAAR